MTAATPGGGRFPLITARADYRRAYGRLIIG